MICSSSNLNSDCDRASGFAGYCDSRSVHACSGDAGVAGFCGNRSVARAGYCDCSCLLCISQLERGGADGKRASSISDGPVNIFGASSAPIPLIVGCRSKCGRIGSCGGSLSGATQRHFAGIIVGPLGTLYAAGICERPGLARNNSDCCAFDYPLHFTRRYLAIRPLKIGSRREGCCVGSRICSDLITAERQFGTVVVCPRRTLFATAIGQVAALRGGHSNRRSPNLPRYRLWLCVTAAPRVALFWRENRLIISSVGALCGAA